MKQLTGCPLCNITQCISFCGSNGQDPLILDLSSGNESHPRQTDTSFEVLVIDGVLRRPDILVDLMDNTFKTTLSKELMDQRGYVLTPDFRIQTHAIV